MDTQNAHARVSTTDALKAAGVSRRTLNRWVAAGVVTPEYDPQFRRAATYDPDEVREAPAKWAALLAAESNATDPSE